MKGKSTSFHKKEPIKCNGKILSFDIPRIMGILNITPDSFYDGSRFNKVEDALSQCGKMVEEGADIIDIGAVSTRPGADLITEKEEVERLLPFLKKIRTAFPGVILSVDTYNSGVARVAFQEGADMINDISGGNFDPEMIPVVASTGLPYVIMHIRGTPASMQDGPEYGNVASEVREFLFSRAAEARQSGISGVIIDPGFGFGKTVPHNYELLRNLASFSETGCPVMAGLSRKSMINRVLKTTPRSALNGTTVLNTLALLNGADILRVHDVREALETVMLVEEYLLV